MASMKLHVCKHLVNEKYLVAVAANLALFRCVDLASYPGPAQLSVRKAGRGLDTRLG